MGWAELKLHEKGKTTIQTNDGVTCVTSGIVRARKVLKEELQNRAENGEETLFLSRASPPKLLHNQKTIPPATQANNGAKFLAEI